MSRPGTSLNSLQYAFALVLPLALMACALPEGTGGGDPEGDAFTLSASGLRYRIIREGEGTKPTKLTDEVTVHYEGRIEGGEVFDSSYERGETSTIPLRNVIEGWNEGLRLIGEGGKIELIVPPELGFGERGSPPLVAPGQTLRFIIELIRVRPGQEIEFR